MSRRRSAAIDPLANSPWQETISGAETALLSLIQRGRGSNLQSTALSRLSALESTQFAGEEDFRLKHSVRILEPSGELLEKTQKELQSLCVPGQGKPDSVSESFEALGQQSERRVCQYAFKRNDIVWICKQCQADETCVLCNDCFIDSDHVGHEVYFYHAQAGGCCDCGDQYAWNPKGCCSRHGKTSRDPMLALPTAFVQSCSEVVQSCAAYLLQYARYERAGHELSRDASFLNDTEHVWPKLESDSYYCVLLEDEIHAEGQISEQVNPFYADPDLVQILRSSCGFVVLSEGSLADTSQLARKLARPFDDRSSRTAPDNPVAAPA